MLCYIYILIHTLIYSTFSQISLSSTKSFSSFKEIHKLLKGKRKKTEKK